MYETDVQNNYCSCKAWKFQKKPNAVRDCKHLIKKRGFALPDVPGYSYKKSKPKFMLLSETVPATPIYNTEDYVFSRKYDGIRVALNTRGELITRGGVVLSELNMRYKPKFQLDGELCHVLEEGHVHVMKALDDKNQYQNLVMRVFDFWPAKNQCIPYVDRYEMLLDMKSNWPKNNLKLVKQNEFHDTVSLQQQINHLLRECVDQRLEGIVVRNKYSCYISDGERNNETIFKAKPK